MPSPGRGFTWRLTLLLLALSPATGSGQQTEPPPAPPADTRAGDDLTVEFVQEQIREIEADVEIDDALKTQILEEYNRTIERLRAAEEWKRKGEEFEQSRINAPRLLEQLRAELAQPSPEPGIEAAAEESLQQLEQRLAQHEAELRTQHQEVQSLEEERKRRADRRLKVPEEIAAARQRLEEIVKELNAPPPADERAELSWARRTHLQARRRAREQELAAYDREILSYDARGELLTARRDLAARQVAQREALVQAWRDVVNERRRVEAESAAREAEQRRRDAAFAHPLVRRMADENLQLARVRTDERLADRIEQAQKSLVAIRRELDRLRNEFADVRSKVDVAGLTKEMGLLLRKNLDTLPDVRSHLRNIDRRQTEMAQINVKLLDAQKARDQLGNLDSVVAERLTELDPAVDDEQRTQIARAARELLQTRRGLWESLTNDYDTYFYKLYELSSYERELAGLGTSYAEYIRRHVLWVPSSSFPNVSDARGAARAAEWIVSRENVHGVAAALRHGAQTRPLLFVAGVLVLTAWFLSRRPLKKKLEAAGGIARRGYPPAIDPTLIALLVTVLLSAFWPAVLWFLAWLLEAGLDPPDSARALSYAAEVTASLFFAAELMRQALRANGLADAHFDWSERTRGLIRHHLRWAMPVILPAVFVASLFEAYGDETFSGSLGRLAFLTGQLALAVFVQRLLHPRTGILSEIIRVSAGGWLDRLRFIWYPCAVALPLLLAGLAFAGYYYTARQLMLRLQATFWFVLAAVIINAVLLRWLLIARRKLAIEQYRKRRAAAQEARAAAAADPAHRGDQESASPESGIAEPAEPQLDLSAISHQTRNLVRSFVSLSLLIGLWIVWVDVLPALRVLDSVVLWSTGEAVAAEAGIGAAEAASSAVAVVTLADMVLAFIVLLMTFLAGKNIPGLLEIAVLQKLPLEPGVRYAITMISRYLITIVGVVIAFGAIGISWSKVQWLAAAITVGLGFGLQEIFANFVSGLIILFERPIRTGDTVTVGNVTGTVSRIRIRATTITDWDRKELVIPNKEFVIGEIVNWTLTDRVLRLIIPVGIAYGSDTRTAHELLMQVARENPRVRDEPEAIALFMGFGDSALNFELRVFVRDIDDFILARHELHMAIDDAFRQAGIEIAFPQRDVHIRSIRGTLPIASDGEPAIPLNPSQRGRSS